MMETWMNYYTRHCYEMLQEHRVVCQKLWVHNNKREARGIDPISYCTLGRKITHKAHVGLILSGCNDPWPIGNKCDDLEENDWVM